MRGNTVRAARTVDFTAVRPIAHRPLGKAISAAK